MSALENEIIEKFRQLPPEKRARLLSTLATLPPETSSRQGSLAAWLAETDAARLVLSPDAPTASELVNEAREERDADILRSLGLRDSAGDSTN